MAEENILGDLTLRSADLQEGYGTRVPNVQKLSNVNAFALQGEAICTTGDSVLGTERRGRAEGRTV